MEIFLDSADPKEIYDAQEHSLIDGVTTTPTLMKVAGQKDLKLVAQATEGDLHVEVLGPTAMQIADAVRRVGGSLATERTVFKIPFSEIGLKACRLLLRAGYRINMHLVYSLPQALLAMKAGATYVCVLVGRAEEQGIDGVGLISDIRTMKDRWGFYESKIMFSSVRSIDHVYQAITQGADAITVPPKILRQMLQNDLTEKGIRQFIEDSKG